MRFLEYVTAVDSFFYIFFAFFLFCFLFFMVIFYQTHERDGYVEQNSDTYIIFHTSALITVILFAFIVTQICYKANKINTQEAKSVLARHIVEYYKANTSACDENDKFECVDYDIVDDLIDKQKSDCIYTFRIRENCFNNPAILKQYLYRQDKKAIKDKREKFRNALKDKIMKDGADMNWDVFNKIVNKTPVSKIDEFMQKQKELAKNKEEQIEQLYKDIIRN